MPTLPSDPTNRPDETLDRIARLAARLLDAPIAALAARDPGGLRIVAAHGVGAPALAALARLLGAV
ncbi:MAG: hypothetical protein ACREOF_05295, partial [Gemmatimonadales bacterium]